MKNMQNKQCLLFMGIVLAGVVCSSGVASETRFISHRGESMRAPENTMAAFRLAVEKGANGFECDVYLTKDNEIICLHDGTAKRTACRDVKPCDATLAELRALDAGSWKGPQFAGEKIPTFAEMLSLARDDFEIFVEVKCGTEIMPKLIEEIKAEPKATPDRVLFICFNANVVAALRKELPAYRSYWLTGTKRKEDGSVTPTAAEAVAKAKACNASGIDAQDSSVITPEYINEVKKAGLSFHLWTVNSCERAKELAAMGADTITSDCGAELVALLKIKDNGTPVLHWPLDGNLKNKGSSGPVFDAISASEPTYVKGVTGQGLSLDGKSDSASGWYQFGKKGTISLWYKPESFYNFNTIFDSISNPNTWEMWIYESGILRFRMCTDSGDVSCDLKSLGGPGNWYHLALVWDSVVAKQAKLYVNGEERDSSSISKWVKPGAVFGLGGCNAGNTNGCGVVDDFLVYSSPLSPDQVKSLFER